MPHMVSYCAAGLLLCMCLYKPPVFGGVLRTPCCACCIAALVQLSFLAISKTSSTEAAERSGADFIASTNTDISAMHIVHVH
jgi:hypothetical protein